MLSNLDLIREFIQNSSEKKEVLLSNPSLKAQVVYDSNELIAKTEGIIASYKLNNTLSEFLISATSTYWELMNEGLAEYNYLLKGEVNSHNFYTYQHCQLPKQYQMHCTKAVFLWRAWWKYRKNSLRSPIQLDLLIRTRDSWYPIRDLIISDGLLYIKTLGSEIAIHSEDLVTWLSKNQVNLQH